MHTETEKPNSCRAIGLHCGECVSRSAMQLAVACGDIPVRDIERIFFVMYDNPACASMSGEFVNSYQARIKPAPEMGMLGIPAFCY